MDSIRRHLRACIAASVFAACAPAHRTPDVDASDGPTEEVPETAAQGRPEGTRQRYQPCARQETIATEAGATVTIVLPCRPYDPIIDSPDPSPL